jgi:hypothetical protein
MENSRLKQKGALVSFFLFLSLWITAQNVVNDSVENHKIPLEKSKSGHLFATVKLENKLTAHAMLESGIPYLMLDSAYFFSHPKMFDLNLEADAVMMNFSGQRIKCRYTTKDTIHVNDLMYVGKILIGNLQSKNKDLLLPLQKLVNPLDNMTRIYELDMEEGYLLALKRTALKEKTKKHRMYPMTNDGYKKMYAVKLKYKIFLPPLPWKEYSLKGDYLLDLGNASFLFFLAHHPDFKQFIKKAPIKIVQAKNKAGKALPFKGFYAPRNKIGKDLFHGQSIGITPFLTKFTTVGILGLKYFQQFNVVFDFDKKHLYLKRK